MRTLQDPPFSRAAPRAVSAVVLLFGLATVAGASPVRAAEPIFREVADAWGLDFVHHHGGSGRRYMPESMVGGTVVFDYDGDGDPDVLFVDGAALPGYEGPEPRTRLYRNDGTGRFHDVTDESGIELDVYGCGGTAGDVDGDGDLDLYLTAFGPNHLFLNRGDGTFVEVGAQAGVDDPRWSASAGFADPDRDGDLDLYVANYVDFTLETHKFCGDRERDIQGYCHPDAYDGVPDRYYRNRGDGTFVEATEEVGLDVGARAGLGVVWGDLDDDGWQDLYVANDTYANHLFHNRGDGTFEDLSLLSGSSHSDKGRPEAGMGVDLGDVDGDGLFDIVVTNFEFESNALYRNTGSALFVDGRFTFGVAEPSLPKLAFGVILADFDHDADLDLAIANGHIQDQAARLHEGSRFAQPNQYLENTGGGRFEVVEGSGFEEPVRVSRGMASGDLDGDGDPDLVVANADARADVYENLTGSESGDWLQVDLRSDSGERHGIGARLELVAAPAGKAEDRVQVREVRTASSYVSQSALTAHYGLGAAERIERLTVRWPDGAAREIRGLPRNRRVLVFE